jgi:hypothetical protein
MTYPQFAQIIFPVVLLVLVGLALNRVVDTASARGLDHYAWGFVVLGTGATVGLSALYIGWQAAAIVLGCFAASGTPMVVGALIRHERRLAAERAEAEAEKARILELLHADQTKTPGQ